jgi:site-specific recombinase XerD
MVGPMCEHHTFGTQLVRAGVDLVTVAELMCHARPATHAHRHAAHQGRREREIEAPRLEYA